MKLLSTTLDSPRNNLFASMQFMLQNGSCPPFGGGYREMFSTALPKLGSPNSSTSSQSEADRKSDTEEIVSIFPHSFSITLFILFIHK